MTYKQYCARRMGWIAAFYGAMFNGNVKYCGNGHFIGMSLLKNTYPRQLGLDFAD